MKIRRLIELASRGKRFRRHLPPEFGRAGIVVSPDAQLKYLKPGHNAFDPLLLNVVEAQIRSGMSVWDIGANVGVFTVAAAARGAHAIAFEPDLWLVGLLEETCRLPQNRELDLKVVPVAVSDKDGLAKFMIADRGRASNALEEVGGHSQMGGVRHLKIVPTLTLSTIGAMFGQPDFIKIDVEGAEMLVLHGARNVMEKRPRLLVEVSREHVQPMTKLLTESGYSLFNAETDWQAIKPVSQCTNNTLALPAGLA